MHDELVKDLRDSAEWADRLALLMGRAEGDAHAPVMRKAADAIEELQATVEGYESSTNMAFVEKDGETVIEFQPKWIPVTERLPEDNEMVLCFTPVDGYMCVGYHYSYKWSSDTVSKWRIITAMRSTKDITKKVTHWMPLPPAPKEEE